MAEKSPKSTAQADPTNQERPPGAKMPGPEELVWSYRGYQMRPGEFNTAMVHFYRGEITRSNMWRQRLDATTNWAVIMTGASISLAFGQEVSNHGAIILSTLLITIFLFLEARRYRYYELWSYRIRLLETDFYAAMLVPPFQPARDWAETLAESLLQPKFPISMLEAFGRRFRRNYIWLYIILALAWLLKILLHPEAPASMMEFVQRAAIGAIPGWLVLSVGLGFNGLLMLIGLLTAHLREASGEVLPRYSFSLPGMPGGWDSKQPESEREAWFRPTARRQQLIVHIITDKAKAVSEHILREMKRGVTSLAGVGMYTGKPHSILMCALTVTEVAQLKALVSAEDPHAFITISPAQEVLGSGFASLQKAK